MKIFLLGFLNGLILTIYCYFTSSILLKKHELDLKNIIVILLHFFTMYYCILCLLDSIYDMFFSGLCMFIFIKILFRESVFMSLLISLIIHSIKLSFKMVILTFLNNPSFRLFNTYKTLTWNGFYINSCTLILSALLIFILRKKLRKLIKYVSSLENRKYLILIFSYLCLTLTLVYQPPKDLFSPQTITDLLMIFTVTGMGIFSISSEMKMETLNHHYQEIFEYSKANGELIANYRMQVHENKNKLLMIKGMIDGPKKETKKYIDSLLNEIEDNKNNSNYWLTELRYIPFPGIRNFINYKLIQLRELNTEVEVFVSSELEKIDASSITEKEYNQLTTILGVILDNMIDSISETDNRLVSINIYIEDEKIHGEFVNSFSGKIDLSRLNEIGYSTKGEEHGVGLPLVARIIKLNNRFACDTQIMDNFFIQHITIKLFDKNNLQKISKK